jgi:hypothetical protein
MSELTRRYVVMTMAAAAPFDHADRDAPFVLKPWKDPAALVALKAYRDHCYAELARDLDEWIRAIEAAPVLRGDIGQRNEAHLASARAAPAPPGAGGARRPGAKPRTRTRAKARAKRPRIPRRATRVTRRAKRRRS